MQDNSQAISQALEAERRRLAARLREILISPISLIQAQVHTYEVSVWLFLCWIASCAKHYSKLMISRLA
jgi:hypothetical protein